MVTWLKEYYDATIASVTVTIVMDKISVKGIPLFVFFFIQSGGKGKRKFQELNKSIEKS
jgi:hypothetical protein